MKQIKLTHGKFAMVDDEDFEELNKWKWNLMKVGYASAHIIGSGKYGKSIYMHRKIMNTPKGMETDHIDGDKLNNQKSNLRLCTSSENKMNREMRVDNKSGYKGVFYFDYDNRKKKWLSFIGCKGKRIRIGYFNCPTAAALAYDKKAKEIHGEFASLNIL